ncbi:hypothetical protein [Fervidobacterium thailandense]|uniref:Uncharacterized protein n=1 Tax=Fervidobacterium thailandense TaxID=1008305 RepID=A0A1E3G378_9BACT|nr:hypothetical protein [Fervidobacterium thailandense]ODN30725.1 hypothetical protein A4H02_04140 [Fervidobacterium thailandense]
MWDELLLAALLFVVVFGVIFFWSDLAHTFVDPENELVKFIESAVDRKTPIGLSKITAQDVTEDLTTRLYLLYVLAKNNFDLCDKASFVKNPFEEQFALNLQLVSKGTSFKKPETAIYRLSSELRDNKLLLTIEDVKTGKIMKTQAFKFPRKYNEILSKVREAFPSVVDAKYSLRGEELYVGIIANYPFTKTVTIKVNDKNFGTFELKNELLLVTIPNVKVGERYQIDFTPTSPTGKTGATLSHRFVLEPPPQAVTTLSYEIQANKITYLWTHQNRTLQELKFKVETPKGVFYTEDTKFSEELVLGRIYQVNVTVVAKFGESEPKSILVKTPPSKPLVNYRIDGNIIKLTLTNTCDYPVTFLITVDGRTFETTSQTFEYKIPTLGLTYTFEISATDGRYFSEPIKFSVQTKK